MTDPKTRGGHPEFDILALKHGITVTIVRIRAAAGTCKPAPAGKSRKLGKK